MGVGFVGDFFDVKKAREAMKVLTDASTFANGERPRVSRTNKVVLQVSAANIDSVNGGAASHTTGTPSTSGCSSSTCGDVGSDHDSDQASRADWVSVVPLQRRRARSACRYEDKDIAEIRLIGNSWQYSPHQRWSAQVSVRGTFINVAELRF